MSPISQNNILWQVKLRLKHYWGELHMISRALWIVHPWCKARIVCTAQCFMNNVWWDSFMLWWQKESIEYCNGMSWGAKALVNNMWYQWIPAEASIFQRNTGAMNEKQFSTADCLRPVCVLHILERLSYLEIQHWTLLLALSVPDCATVIWILYLIIHELASEAPLIVFYATVA